ncbi:TetR/AcrR family transcriptional regulator [Photobacterium profundum]|uniref:Probable transcriptional regulator n=1 Tax=Photobacterium profundum 3TCK TaxID=314280 RepID=Q1Z6F7_9GAMM|nr:TetR/AcrR family transcriptional regulator [Photobacterium profundum]EAS44190.1 probable transcriptional regulator [Photobacterium profundum 3TCK]PSV59810.1 TetR/AcrR family transcriptional regulator [Photobacterium profundum]
MARVVKAPDERRNEFIVTAQNLFYTKGYESTSVNDIIQTMGVSKGAFYHYFSSKQAILEMLVESLLSQYQALVQALLTDPAIDAVSKWQQLVQMTNNWKVEQKTEMLSFTQIINMDENVLLKHKLVTESTRLLVADYALIIKQGMDEGVFDIQGDNQADSQEGNSQDAKDLAELLVAMLYAFSDRFTELLLNQDQYDQRQSIELIQRKLRTTQAAIERILRAPQGSLPLIDQKALNAWFS